jgi:hypothetical protein
MSWKRFVVPAVVALLFTAPVFAQELAYRGIGPRVGVTSDPDQGFVGLHINFGEFAPHLRFIPNFEAAAGDDFTIFSVTAPVHYRFPVQAEITPYAGGGITAAFVDIDLPRGRDDTDFEIAAKAIGGVSWPFGSGNEFFLELNVGFGDIQDAAVLAGWIFGGGGRSPAPSPQP